MQGREIEYWLELIYRRRTTVLTVAAMAFSLVLLGTLLWPPVYRSTAQIIVQGNRAQYLISPDLEASGSQRQQIAIGPVSEEQLNSEVELLTSVNLIERSVATLPPPEHFSAVSGLVSGLRMALDLPTAGYRVLHSTPRLNDREKWALALEKHLSASVIKRSSIIEVGFSAHDPHWTKDFLSRLINEYLEYHGRLSNDPQAEKFFQEQMQLLQTRLNASQDKLRAYQVQSGITDLPAQRQALVTQLSNSEIELEKTGAQLASAREQVTTLQSQLGGTSQRIGKEVRQEQNLALQQIKPQVMQLEAERAELLSRYQPTSERIKEIDQKLAAAHRILDRENHLEVRQSTTDLNPVWVTLDTNLEQAKTSVAAEQATQNALNSQITQMHAHLGRMANDAVEIDRLERQVANDKEAYLSYVRKTEEARTAQALNLNKLLNVNIAQQPSLPLRPVSPKVALNLLAGLVLGVLLGLGAADWEERRDPKIYSTAAIAKVSGLSTIAVLRDEV